jgi:hypothetical protein
MSLAGILLGSVDIPLRFKILLWGALGVTALLAVFLLFFFITCLRERQHLVGDVEPAIEPFPYSPSPYWRCTRQDALDLGWQYAGDFATKKETTIVKGMFSIFLSPDRRVMAGIFSGSAAGAKLHKTILRSRLEDGSVLESCDLSGMSDPTGVLRQETLHHAGIAELSDFHAQRLQTLGANSFVFDPENALCDYEKMNWDRGARWVELGLAYWVEPEQRSIRMTMRGAMTQIQALFKKMSEMKEQKHRAELPRAGSRVNDI